MLHTSGFKQKKHLLANEIEHTSNVKQMEGESNNNECDLKASLLNALLCNNCAQVRGHKKNMLISAKNIPGPMHLFKIRKNTNTLLYFK